MKFRNVQVAVVALLLAAGARADLVITLQPEHTLLCQHEAINMFVTVSNNGARAVTLDPQRRPGSAYLDFDVRRMEGGTPRTIALAPLTEAVGVIEPDSSRRYLIDLARVGNLHEIGGYNIQPFIIWDNRRYETRQLHINVVGGLPLKSGPRDSPLAPSARRTYALSYLVREGRETLFLSVNEEPSGLNYGVFPLGALVRVFEPVIEVDSRGGITVVHQTGPHQFARSLLQSTAGGVRLVDQSYEQLHGRMGAKGVWEEPKVDMPAKDEKER